MSDPTTLRLLAQAVNRMEVGFPEAERHLDDHGWKFIVNRYYSPEEVAERCRVLRNSNRLENG